MRPLSLSVLDQSVPVTGSGEDAAIRDTLDLAQHCERLGYARFWVSEHHGLPTIIGSTPEILMAAIAARTTRIRIGSPGVMLPHCSALKVAAQLRTLVDALQLDKIVVNTWVHDAAVRRTSCALLAREFGLVAA